ncbi:hypothetical protein SAMN05444360_114102 [Chryseobacterium carnipullorum]|uniref:hypothetical protein n=1 Tax=Chryseobacterium carnipullorum TaxID=1124835 RepID=UPI000915599D|nr:hypothetical protein [Chryseobacterium carnipullorum]SHM60350.1 hypothetical protein SAMN05444360_114102 [Chryseobacterium carnipullorum]
MKKLLLIIGFVCFQSFSAQSIMDFDLKNVELQGMKPARIDKEMKDIGITKIPFVTSDPDIISKIEGPETAATIKNFYTFTYNNPKGDDGGVMVYEFKTKPDLEVFLAKNFEQSNARILVKGLFCINIWSDYSLYVKGKESSEDHLNKLEKYYVNLGAKRVKLQEMQPIDATDQ